MLREGSRLPYVLKRKEYPDINVNNTQELAEFCINELHMDLFPEEYTYMFALATNNAILGFFEISVGSINYSVISARDLFMRAVLLNAASMIIVHNHPSGDCKFSGVDTTFTENILSVGKVLGLSLLDHVVIGNKKYFSYREYVYNKEGRSL